MIQASGTNIKVTAAAIALVLGAGALQRSVRAARGEALRRYRPLAMELSRMPSRDPYAVTRDIPLVPRILQITDVDRFLNREYVDTRTGRLLSLWVGYWGRERVLWMHGPEHCYVANGWSVAASPRETNVRIAGPDGDVRGRVELHRFVRSDSDGTRQCVVGFVRILDGRLNAGSRRGFWHRPDAPAGGGHFSARVLASTAVRSGDWVSRERDLLQFMESILTGLWKCWPAAPVEPRIEGNG